MRRRDIYVKAVTLADPDTVYRLLADGSTWPQWSPIDSFRLERPGEIETEGIGAIRVFRRGRTTGRDELLELIPNRRIKYASLSGLPVNDYVGEIDLEATPRDRTMIVWHSSFSAKVPGTGWIIERGLRRFLKNCAGGLSEYAHKIERDSLALR